MKKNIGRIMLFLSCVAIVTTTTTVYAWNNFDNEYVGDDLCNHAGAQAALNVVSWLILIMKMFIPLLIIIFGSLDMYKAVLSGEAEGMKKAGKSLGFRVALGVFIFFLPTLTKTFLGYLLPKDYSTCVKCLLEPGTCKGGVVIPTADPDNQTNDANSGNGSIFTNKPTTSSTTSRTPTSGDVFTRREQTA